MAFVCYERILLGGEMLDFIAQIGDELLSKLCFCETEWGFRRRQRRRYSSTINLLYSRSLSKQHWSNITRYDSQRAITACTSRLVHSPS